MPESRQPEWKTEQQLLAMPECWEALRPKVQSLPQRDLTRTVAELQRKSWGLGKDTAPAPQRAREAWELPTLWP